MDGPDQDVVQLIPLSKQLPGQEDWKNPPPSEIELQLWRANPLPEFWAATIMPRGDYGLVIEVGGNQFVLPVQACRGLYDALRRRYPDMPAIMYP